MKDFISEELTIKIEVGDGEVIMDWIGKSRDREPSKILIPYFDEIVQGVKGKKFVIDFRNLNIMNSSTVPPIVKFIKSLEDAGVKTEIFYDKSIEWQKASFKALETVTTRFQNITINGEEN